VRASPFLSPSPPRVSPPFLLDPHIAHAGKGHLTFTDVSSVPPRQQSVSTQRSELEDLEARLRDAEARLKDRQSSRSSSSPPPPKPGVNDDHRGDNAQRSRPGPGGAFDTPGRNNNATRGRDSLRNNGDVDGNGNSMRRNGTSPLASAVTEENRPRLRGNTSSDGNIHCESYDAAVAANHPPLPSAPSNDLRHHSPHRNPAAPHFTARQENTPPQTSRNRDVRRKSFAASRQDKGGGSGNLDGAASLRGKRRGKS
jgi:hypothetical protein